MRRYRDEERPLRNQDRHQGRTDETALHARQDGPRLGYSFARCYEANRKSRQTLGRKGEMKRGRLTTRPLFRFKIWFVFSPYGLSLIYKHRSGTRTTISDCSSYHLTQKGIMIHWLILN